MIKVFLIVLSFISATLNAQQIILVVAADFNSSKALLSGYEDGKTVFQDIDVNIGKNGLGWGIGFQKLPHGSNEPLKKEGDKKAPAGIFKIGSAFGYEKSLALKIPYLYADSKLICVDDSDSKDYNKIINFSDAVKSFEYMKRDDLQYKYGLVVVHNPHQEKQRGSCIFLHVEKSAEYPTVGCTSMKEDDIVKILKWLDPNKDPIFIQVPKKYLNGVYALYPELKR